MEIQVLPPYGHRSKAICKSAKNSCDNAIDRNNSYYSPLVISTINVDSLRVSRLFSGACMLLCCSQKT